MAPRPLGELPSRTYTGSRRGKAVTDHGTRTPAHYQNTCSTGALHCRISWYQIFSNIAYHMSVSEDRSSQLRIQGMDIDYSQMIFINMNPFSRSQSQYGISRETLCLLDNLVHTVKCPRPSSPIAALQPTRSLYSTSQTPGCAVPDFPSFRSVYDSHRLGGRLSLCHGIVFDTCKATLKLHYPGNDDLFLGKTPLTSRNASPSNFS